MKIIQIQADHGWLYALDDEGKVYQRRKEEKVVDCENKNNKATRTDSYWEEIEKYHKGGVYERAESLPF